MAYESWFYWKGWEDYLGVKDEASAAAYYGVGCLLIKTDQNKQLADVCRMIDEVDCPHTHLQPPEIEQHLAGVHTQSYNPPKRSEGDDFGKPTGPSASGAVDFPRGGNVSDPKPAAHNVQRSAEAVGVDFIFNAAVTEIRQDDGRACGVTLADGAQIDAPIVVNVAGPHSFVINKMAGVTDDMQISTRALRHEVAHVPAPEGLNFDTHPTIYSDSDIYTYARPEVGNNILIGPENPARDTQEWVEEHTCKHVLSGSG